jgi:hypothetical protein
MNLSGRICAMLRYRPWQYTKYSLRALPCLTQIRLGNLSQRLIGEEYKATPYNPSSAPPGKFALAELCGIAPNCYYITSSMTAVLQIGKKEPLQAPQAPVRAKSVTQPC